MGMLSGGVAQLGSVWWVGGRVRSVGTCKGKKFRFIIKAPAERV